MDRLPLLILACAAGLGLLACSSGKEPSRQPLPSDFQLRIGSGGGFAGLDQGYTVAGDGSVQQWIRPAAGAERVEGRGIVPPDSLHALWERLQAARALALEASETGNLTRFLEITAGGRTNRLSWPDGQPPSADLGALYQTIHGTLARAVPR